VSWARKFGVSAAVLVAVVTWCVDARAETVTASDAGCACGVSRHAGARDGVVFGGLLLLPLARRLRRARPRPHHQG
jgi:hypothetical protein